MSLPGDSPTAVGQQLAQRREELDLTQEALARRIGITAATVSNSERGRTEITRSKRAKWEKALRLVPGSISHAYRSGAPLARLADDEFHVDLGDQYERAIWELDIDEDDKRTIIGLLRADRADRADSSRHTA